MGEGRLDKDCGGGKGGDFWCGFLGTKLFGGFFNLDHFQIDFSNSFW